MEKNRYDDAGPARQELDDASDVAPERAEEAIPAQELPPEEAAAADSDHAPVPDSESSARIPEDV